MKDFSTPKKVGPNDNKRGRLPVPNSVREEQQFVEAANDLLQGHITHLRQRISDTVAAPGTGTGQDEIEREALLDTLHQQLNAATAAAKRLCFGRIVFSDGDDDHVGRIGLRGTDGEVVLLDWRAPHAAPFYQATDKDPMGLVLRRRIASRMTSDGPEVTHVDDEDFTGTSALSSGAASAVEVPRDGRMADILATIAADQDAIIRSPLDQVTVVEGGPGTGKTVVALHRAAWLLYTYRDKLARDGVLIVGPSTVFLQYIDQVLPSLGETDVVLLTPEQLFPVPGPLTTDAGDVARIKGDARMAEVIARAVAQRVRIPEQPLVITTSTGTRVRLSAQDIARATKGISRSRNFHEGREPFLRRVLAAAAANVARDTGHDPTDDDYCLDVIASLVEDINIRRELNLMWLPTTPEKVLGRLLSDPETLRGAATGILSPAEQGTLLRPNDSPWSTDDIALLDEAADLLGPWSPPVRSDSAPSDYRELQASDAYRITPDSSRRDRSTLAERALDDREWIYGHVIVDEAQELSAMSWRAIQRRASRRSMTIVGDLQQAAHPASARDWNQALSWAKDRVHKHELTITYRITRQIASVAGDLLVAAGGRAPSIRPIRDGDPVVFVELPLESIKDYAIGVARPDGRSAVIVPDSLICHARDLLEGQEFGFADEALDAAIAVLTASQTKGLEFDCVVIIDPQAISDQRPRGSDIYVAATRATQTLHVVTIAPSPARGTQTK